MKTNRGNQWGYTFRAAKTKAPKKQHENKTGEPTGLHLRARVSDHLLPKPRGPLTGTPVWETNIVCPTTPFHTLIDLVCG